MRRCVLCLEGRFSHPPPPEVVGGHPQTPGLRRIITRPARAPEVVRSVLRQGSIVIRRERVRWTVCLARLGGTTCLPFMGYRRNEQGHSGTPEHMAPLRRPL